MSFGGINHDGTFGYEIPQELHFRLFEPALLCFEVEWLPPQNLEYLSHYFFVELLVVRCSNNDVVHKPEQISWIFAFELCKNSIHELLKGGWGISQSKGHHIGFEEPKRCLEGSFPPILRFDPDVVISVPYVKFGH
jgi:hypothetical protein